MFVATKMILVAAPVNGTSGLPSLIVPTVSVYVKQTPKKKKRKKAKQDIAQASRHGT